MKYIYIAITLLLCISCEDVVVVDLQEGPKRLVIDANINWEKGTPADNQTQQIRLTETTGFYDITIPPANGATVSITNSKGDIFNFTEDGNSGIYETNNFEAEIDETYVLNITYKDENYTATETLKSVAPIINVEQSIQKFFGTELGKVEFFFQDPEDEENYYINQFNAPAAFKFDSFGAREDKFTNGQINSVFEQDENLKPGNTITLYLYGASKTYYNYFQLLLDQVSSGGPFGTPPAAVRGNCINTTNPDNKPLGYFRLSEMVVEEYIIKPYN